MQIPRSVLAWHAFIHGSAATQESFWAWVPYEGRLEDGESLGEYT